MSLADFFKSASDLFKSAKQREQEKARHRRQAFRRAERALDDVNAKLKGLEKRGKDAWSQARDAMKSGEKAAAQRHLTQYRATEVLAAKVDQKRFAFEQSLINLEMAETDGQFADALNVLATVVDIDPEKHDDVLTTVDMKRCEQADVDKLWQKEYERHMEGAEGALHDFVPSIEDLAKQLEDEVAEEVGTPDKTPGEGELADKIEEGRARVRKLLDEEDE